MAPEIITSTHNERVKRLRSLRERKFRQQTGRFLLEGDHCVTEALRSGAGIDTLLVTEAGAERYAVAVAAARDSGAEVLNVSETVMETVCDARSPQGIAAVTGLILRDWEAEAAAVVGKPGFIVILENIQDPGNLGTVIRTADAAGATGILLSRDCADIHSPKVVRSTMGSLFHLPVWQSADLPAAVRGMAAGGWAILCGHLMGQGFYSRKVDGLGEALVIGNEGAGVSQALQEACTHLVRLPMAGKAESLNAAVAAGIMIYDMARSMGILKE